jgi:DNA-binding transcriptional LysR family regulator
MIGSLSLDQLRVLVTIADTGSFSAAGRALGRAQSAISQIIASLEGAQGVSLFDRSGHRPRLTDIGDMRSPLRGGRRQHPCRSRA